MATKIMTWLATPLAVGGVGVLLGILCLSRARRGWGLSFLWLGFAWLWLWSSPWFFMLVGGALESACPPADVRALPRADVIVVLGGGMGPKGAKTRYPELFQAADRGWHAARCYHAGRAPKILFSGIGEGPGIKQFLVDLGVPPAKIILENASRNTYENGLNTRAKLKELKAGKVILVTSAWHMRRSVMIFKEMGVEVVPAGCDYEALHMRGGSPGASIFAYLPNADCLSKNTAYFKELLGHWVYWCWFRVKG